MKKMIVIVLVFALTFTLAACVTTGRDTDDVGNTDTSDSPLVGTWVQRDQGVHGNALYFWSFSEDGHFAYLFTAYEPPQAGGTIESSVREIYIQGRFRENGNTIELYNVKVDDYFSWGDKWRYFSDRDPALLADKLLTTSLKKPKSMDDFTASFELKDSESLRIVLDLGDFPHQYDMQFEFVATQS